MAESRNVQTGDIAKDLITEMVKAMVVLSERMSTLVQKVEDLTSAIDDHRAVDEDLVESTGDLSGLIDTVIQVIDDASGTAVEEERGIRWEDIQAILKKIKTSASAEVEVEEEDDGK